MGRWGSWAARTAVTVAAGSLLVAATLTGAAPAVWSLLGAHDEVPVALPAGFSGLATRSTILSAGGEQIGVFEFENSQPLEISAIPDRVVAAVLAVEDEGFARHRGVNLRSLVRAALSNFRGSARQGASTITQQVVKNEFLAGLPRDGRYKILQARYSVMLEKAVPKESIVGRYLNTVYFGHNAYGIQAAAEVYFGARVADLTLAQAGFLAGLVQAPSAYDPINRPQRALRRFGQVLDRFVATGLMTTEEAEITLGTFEIPVATRSVPRQTTSRTYMSEMIRDFLLNRSTVLGQTYSERFTALYRGGLRITTTIDAAAQKDAEKSARTRLPENEAGIQSALVSLDTGTAAVRALVGGPGFVPGRTEVNLALRRRQTGSSVKMFVLAAALEAGVEGIDLIDGTLPCTFPNPGQPEEPFTITKGVSKPLTTLAEQTWLSINCAYARLAQIVGLDRLPPTVYRLASSAYLRPETHRIWPYASFSTGANEMSALDMASGAQTIANGGLHHEPFFIERIDDSMGRTIFQHVSAGVQAMTKAAADKEVAILKQTLVRGTARRTPLEGNRPAAGKTGTQAENTNAWFVGFTRQLTTAVWVGDPKGYTPMVNIPEFRADGVPRVQGATYPARIWKSYMDAAHSDLEVLDWDAPPAPSRPAVRLHLPGVDCLAEVVAGALPKKLTGVDPAAPVTATTVAPATTLPGAPVTTVAASRRPVVSIVDPGTTIAPGVTDPYVPVTGVDPHRFLVYDCAKGLPASVASTATP